MSIDSVIIVALIVALLGAQLVLGLYVRRANRESILFREATKKSIEESVAEIKAIQQVVRDKTHGLYGRTKRDQIDTYRQIMYARDIDEMLEPGITRNLRGWAISPDALMVVLRYVEQYKPKVIVELGGGYSTVALTRLIKKNKLPTQVISVDHDASYLEQTKHLVGGSPCVTYVHAPLVDYDEKYSWYDIKSIKEVVGKKKADLVIVDGPPESTNKYARRPVMEQLKGLLDKQYTIILDDAERPDEKGAIEDWVGRDKRLKHEYIYTEKGLSVVTTNKDLKGHQLL